MAPATTQMPFDKGSNSLPQNDDARRRREFYAQALQLQEQVLAGTHPRIKLSDSARKELAQLVSQGPHPTHWSSAGLTVNGTSSNNVHPPAPSRFQNPPNVPSNLPPPAAPGMPPSIQRHPLPMKPTYSGINPVLLTKSDDLIRAEMQLERQRTEREMKDQIDAAKKRQWHDKALGLDPEPRLDLSELLAKAREVVPPISGLTVSINQNSTAIESPGENSYYSSQANSCSSDDNRNAVQEGTPEPTLSSKAQQPVKDKEPVVEVDSSSDQARGPPQDDELDDIDYEPTADIQQLDPTQYHTSANFTEQEDSDYSPPPAGPSAGQGRVDEMSGALLTDSTSGLDGAGDRSPPPRDAQVIGHGVRSPIALQSSLSNVTTGKARNRGARGQENQAQQPSRKTVVGKNKKARRAEKQRAWQNMGRRTSPQPPIQQSPNGASQNARTSRKRRREAEQADSSKRVARSPDVLSLEDQAPEPRSPILQSPEPYIKPEPESPQPLRGATQDQALRRHTVHSSADETLMYSPRDSRLRALGYREAAGPRYSSRLDLEEPAPPTLVRVPSSHVVVQRDDHDLRRVASLQFARRPYSPGPQPIVYQDLRSIRAASHAYIDPPPQPVIYRSGSIRPDHMQTRARTPPLYIEDGFGGSRIPLTMAPPPPRPVFVDEHGVKYYAAPPQEPAPLQVPRVRRAEGEVPYERSVSRVPPREMIVYEDESMRPPPPPPARRFIAPDMEYAEPQPAYRPERAYSMRPTEAIPPRESPYVSAERRPAPTIIYEDLPPPREYAARAYSLRPEIARRDGPPEYVTRHESIQPGYIRRVEQPPAFTVEPPPRRYVGEELDGYGDASRHESYRY